MKKIKSNELANVLMIAMYGVEGMDEGTTLEQAVEILNSKPNGLFEYEERKH
ncbi:hypothetical protein P3T66_06655 [Latilactobacillus sakei]|uniref:hypothetical protein n=1 Tax=Latilactobacillus sakei TaxID=1599 RepID=UPI00019CED48|nr:hypothetical protein [Latilactobacillus sakei]WEY49781.1 hypothetical protein P3T66_06655 [Latilactobacillus sakei]GEP20621.1 hypothetical protein LSA03nite_02090 [Latilactobacillus sakei subsp. carnosus]